jgi:hypothetical protein
LLIADRRFILLEGHLVIRSVNGFLRLCVAAIVWSAAAVALGAQGVAALSAGTPIAVTVSDTLCSPRPWRRCAEAGSVSGTLVRATADTLVLQIGSGEPTTLRRNPAQRIYLRERGFSTRASLRSALVFGTLAGLIMSQTDASRAAWVRVTVGAAAGGFAAEAFMPTERWRRVTP